MRGKFTCVVGQVLQQVDGQVVLVFLSSEGEEVGGFNAEATKAYVDILRCA